VEIRGGGPSAGGGFPPFAGRNEPWSDSSLAMAVGRAVLGSLVEAGLLRRQYRLHVGERLGGYVRLFVEDAEEADSALFAESVHEALGPLDRPRYVIPRYADELRDTWLSKILPAIVAQYFRRRRRGMAMLHAVPSALAKHKDLAAIYSRHWNVHVSPGQAVYAYQGEGERLVERARREGCMPDTTVRDKEVFL
jgi:phytoene dehydrogenase-like protein